MAKKIRTLTQMAFSFDEPEAEAAASEEAVAASKASPSVDESSVVENASTPASETIGFRIKSIKKPVIVDKPESEAETEPTPLVEAVPLPELFPSEEVIVSTVEDVSVALPIVEAQVEERHPPIETLIVEEVLPIEMREDVVAPVKEAPNKVKKAVTRVKSTSVKSNRGRKSIQSLEQNAALLKIPTDDVLFQKQYYPIGEVAEMFGVNTSLIRFWTNEFEMIKPRLNRKGDRLFRPVDIKNLLVIHELLRGRKLTIQGAKQFLKTEKKVSPPTPIAADALTTLNQIRSFLVELKTMLQ